MCVCVCACVCVCVRACVRACVRVCIRVYVYVYVGIRICHHHQHKLYSNIFSIVANWEQKVNIKLHK